jgi:DNA helicase-2/ATP-dependent DNA helicase PcrA
LENREIVLLTLTNATARTLRDRFPAVPVRTLHAYALTALDELGAAWGKKVADRWEQKELVRRDIQRIAKDGGHPYDIDVIDDFLTALGMGFREGQTAEPILTGDEAIIRAAWERVREFLALRVFDEFAPDLEQQLREGREMPNPPRAIVVDEYQDLTAVELRVIELIGRSADAGVFACGDDMQSIYAFRGADTGGLSNFSAVYGVEGPAYLSISWRCPSTVMNLAEEVAARMPAVPGFAPRPRMTSHEDRGTGETRLLTFPSLTAESRWVVTEIARRRAETPDDTVAVLVASNLRIYVSDLNRASAHRALGLVFTDSRTPLEFVDSAGFRVAYALLRLTADSEDQLAWRTVLHLAPGQRNVRIRSLYGSGDSPLSVALRARAQFDSGLKDIAATVMEGVAAIAASESSEMAIEAIDKTCSALGAGGPPWEELQAIVDEPAAVDEETPAETPDVEPWMVLLAAAKGAARQVAGDRKPGESEVFVYTVFQAKGQEWDHVFLAGAYDRGFRDQHQVGEGVRLLYVALTRACKSLTISKLNSAGRGTQLAAALGTSSPTFPSVLTEAAASVGLVIEVLGPQD